MSDLSELIKKMAVGVINDGSPCDIVVGVVEGINPLAVKISDNITISEDFIVLTRNVTDYVVSAVYRDGVPDITVAGETVSPIESGTEVNLCVLNALKIGDNVVMIKAKGGQKFVIIDRVGGGYINDPDTDS